jgi:hypothetical protein
VFSSGGATHLERVVFAFGSHPLATPDDAHAVTTADALNNKLRIVMDELLRGNDLEEIACRYPVDPAEPVPDNAFDRVPIGATPDDIARCSVTQDALTARCPGSDSRSLCLCKSDGGCPTGVKLDGSPNVTPRGASVGILDANQDGAADRMRFIPGAVAIVCGGTDIPLDLDNSYWTPSGNQQKPAHGGFDALGPAVVLATSAGLPTSTECGVRFSSDVVDKDGNQVCAPPGGDITLGCAGGDTSAVKFTTEPLLLRNAPQVTDPGQSRKDDVTFVSTAPLDPASLTTITVTEGAATSYTQFTAMLVGASMTQFAIHWTAPAGLAAGTRYTLTIPTTVTDAYHKSAAQPLQVAFTTGAN